MGLTDQGKIAFERADFTTARALFEEAAAAGDALAAYHLGTMCSRGQGGPEDAARAVALYRRAAEAGVADAAYNLAAATALGRGVRVDPAGALRWYERAADLGDRDALYRAGSMHAIGEGTRPDHARAVTFWERAAKLGHAPSMLLLGQSLAVDDPAPAMRWLLEAATAGEAPALAAAEALLPALTAAAEAGQAEAQRYLGGAVLSLGRDPAEAARWFEAASAQGNAAAQRSLASLCEKGEGTAKDPARAMALYRSAAEAGDAIAQYTLGNAHLLGKGVSVDLEQGITWLRRAAEQGFPRAFLPLATQLAELDREPEARPWLARAAEQGNPAIMLHVGRWYRDGVGGPVDRVQAARWFMTAFVAHQSGDAIQEMHEMAGAMSEDELWEAARLSGGESVAATFLSLRGDEE